MPTTITDALIQWGPPYIALGLLLWGLWKAAKWIGQRLFADDGGLLTNFFAKLHVALDKQAEASETVIKALADQSVAIRMVERRLTDIAAMGMSESETTHLVEILLSELPVPLAQIGEGGDFIRTNRPIRDLLGYSGEELSGMTFQDVTPSAGDLAADVEQSRRVVQGMPSFRMEKSYRRKDGSDVYCALYVFRFPVRGNFRFFVSCIIPLHPPHGLR